jgi:hypothetical protein
MLTAQVCGLRFVVSIAKSYRTPWWTTAAYVAAIPGTRSWRRCFARSGDLDIDVHPDPYNTHVMQPRGKALL